MIIIRSLILGLLTISALVLHYYLIKYILERKRILRSFDKSAVSDAKNRYPRDVNKQVHHLISQSHEKRFERYNYYQKYFLISLRAFVFLLFVSLLWLYFYETR